MARISTASHTCLCPACSREQQVESLQWENAEAQICWIPPATLLTPVPPTCTSAFLIPTCNVSASTGAVSYTVTWTWLRTRYSSVKGQEKALLTTKLHCGEETEKHQELTPMDVLQGRPCASLWQWIYTNNTMLPLLTQSSLPIAKVSSAAPPKPCPPLACGHGSQCEVC